MIKVTLLMFGPARDLAGTSQAEAELPEGATLRDLAVLLGSRYPAMAKGMESLRFAVRESFAAPEYQLENGDEVAVIPPVSGGAADDSEDVIELSTSPLDPVRIHAHVSNRELTTAGGVCLFEGRTRLEHHERHGPLVALDYEAYGSMAMQQMRDLAGRARRRWPIEALAVVHRTGRVGVGEPSVITAAACGHRAEAFEACRWLIDTVKREVPIWKKEIWQSGESSWAKPNELTDGQDHWFGQSPSEP